MKKSLLLGTALVVGVAGFAQNTAKKAINPKYLKNTSVVVKNKVTAEPQPIAGPSLSIAQKGHQSPAAACNSTIKLTTSWNCFGVGGGSTTSEQNCLSYNKDLNTLMWTQRGSKTWNLTATSGYIQSTLVNVNTLALDSVITYKDANTTNHGRYPSGVLLNPTSNTSNSYTNAIAVVAGQVTNGTNWIGAAYCAKPLWSVSALTHTNPTGDSLFSSAVGGPLGNNAASNFSGAPQTDLQYLGDGKTVVAVGGIRDNAFTATDNVALAKALFVKATLDNTGKAVNWTVDSSIVPNAHKGALGRNLSGPRMAFGPDGTTGYMLFLGILNQTFSAANHINYSDSSMTPIVYKTTDGGATWNQVLAGYDWMCHHPEVEKNVGELTGQKRFYTFDMGNQGADLTVDANNVLHFVTGVSESTFQTGDIDSVGIYSHSYDYDYINHHPIIWDFMTDGTTWNTLLVDSIISAACGSGTTDTTSTHSAMGGSQILAVSSHITVSRSADGSKVFYGWADSDPGVTGQVYNVNPDVMMKAYDVATGKVTATKNATNYASCFYPYLADISYYDAAQSAWVVPVVYTIGHSIVGTTGQTTYDASAQADYYLSNCGTFAASDFSNTANVVLGSAITTCIIGIKTNNAFESSISNFPNPFNGTTTIAVNLSENKAFSINIYNAIGTLVYSKKVNGNVGENTVTFDGSALSSGVYYYTVTAGNQQATKKMIIQK